MPDCKNIHSDKRAVAANYGGDTLARGVVNAATVRAMPWPVLPEAMTLDGEPSTGTDGLPATAVCISSGGYRSGNEGSHHSLRVETIAGATRIYSKDRRDKGLHR